ncbi:hypothetical protein ACWCQN_12790 [Streptomyces sp. NPDC001984]
MALVIVAVVLGVIIITGGLFLRRLLGEIAELRRQITGIDRQMRAQRAREQFFRQLTTEEVTEENDGPPVQASVVNGYQSVPEPRPADGPEPVRRKRHLGLYLGGAGAIIAALGASVRESLREHRNQLVATATTAALTAATVTLVSVQPWSTDADQPPPASAPTAAPSSNEGLAPIAAPSSSPGLQPSADLAAEEPPDDDRKAKKPPGLSRRLTVPRGFANTPGRAKPPESVHAPGLTATPPGLTATPPGRPTAPPGPPAPPPRHGGEPLERGGPYLDVSAPPLVDVHACFRYSAVGVSRRSTIR